MKINGLLRLQKGVNGFRGDRPTERQWQPTNTAHDPNPPITLESGGGGAVTHATTGTLTGAGAALSGTARHNTPHATTGTLTGPGSAVVGSANRFRAHASTGALVGSGSTIAGSANHSPAAVPHTTTGALTGPGSVVVGVSSRFRAHPTTGVLMGAGAVWDVAFWDTGLWSTGAVLSGTALYNALHSTTGTLTGAGSTVSGAAKRFVLHDTNGSLVGLGSSVNGAVTRFRAYDTTGNLTGAGSVITGESLKTSIFITDFHDGDYLKKRIKKERKAATRRKDQIKDAYEILVEGRPAVAAEIVKPYISRTAENPIDFESFMADLERVEWLWKEYIEMDDEEVIALL